MYGRSALLRASNYVITVRICLGHARDTRMGTTSSTTAPAWEEYFLYYIIIVSAHPSPYLLFPSNVVKFESRTSEVVLILYDVYDDSPHSVVSSLDPPDPTTSVDWRANNV